MAEVSHSVSFGKKFSNVNSVSTKHVYDDVFSSTPPATATKLKGSSAFSSRVEDYAEIFASSSSTSTVASLGSSIPILDLPAVDPTLGQITDVDYSGVFGGTDDRIGFLFEELLGAPKKNNSKCEAPLSRIPVQRRTHSSKTQEFPVNSDGNQIFTIPRTRSSKSQEFPRNLGINQMPTSSENDQNICCPGTQTSKSEEFLLDSENNLMSISSRVNNAGTRPSKSQEFPLASGKDQRSASASSFNAAEHFNVSYNRANRNSYGSTQVAELHAVPGYTHLVDESPLPKKILRDTTATVSPNDVNVNRNVDKEMKRRKHTRAISDLGDEERASEHLSRYQRGFSGPLNLPHNSQQANCEPQDSSLSSPWGFSLSFGGGVFFERSTSQRLKGPANSRHKGFGDGSSQLLLEEEMDLNSEAAISAKTMKKAIEEAEVQIRLAKELLQCNDCNGSRLSFKDTLKVRDTGGALRQKKVKTRGIKKYVDGMKGSRIMIEESNVANEVNGHEDSVRLNSAINMAVNSETSQVRETVELSSQYVEQVEPRNCMEQVVKRNDIQGEPKPAQKSHKQEDRGEWEAAKHLSQLFSGVKSRLTSFIPKQPDLEKKVDVACISRSPEMSKEHAGNAMMDMDPERGSDQSEVLEMEFEVNHLFTRSPKAREREEDFHGMEAYMVTRQTNFGADLGHEVVEIAMSPDAKKRDDESKDHLEPELDMKKIKVQRLRIDEHDCWQNYVPTETKGELTQVGPPEINENRVGDSVGPEHGKVQMNTTKVEDHDERSDTISSFGGHNHDAEVRNWKSSDQVEIEAGKEPLEVKPDDSLDIVEMNSGLEEGCIWEEEITIDSQLNEPFEVTGHDPLDIADTNSGLEEGCICEEEIMIDSPLKEPFEVTGDDHLDIADTNSGLEEGCICEEEIMIDSPRKEPLQFKADDSLDIAEKISGLEDGCIWEEEFMIDSQQKEEDVKAVEDTAATEEDKMNQDTVGDLAGPEHGIGEMDTIKLEQYDERLEAISSSVRHNVDMEVASWTSTDEVETKAEVEPLEVKADDSLDNALTKSGLEEGCRWKEREIMSKTQQKEEDVEALEQTAATEELAEEMDEETCIGEEHKKLNTGVKLSDEETITQAGATNDTSQKNEHLPSADNACNLAGSSFINKNEDSYIQGNQNNAVFPDLQVSCDMGIITGLTTIIEPVQESESISSVKVADELISKEMMAASILTGNNVGMDENHETEGKIENELEDTEQKSDHGKVNEFTANVGLGKQGGMADGVSVVGIDQFNSNKNDRNLPVDKHEGKPSVESSLHKRRRWFENRVEMESSPQPSILQVDEMSVETNLEEHADESKMGGCVEVHVSELVNEAGPGLCSEPADPACDQEGEYNNFEATHRRRRWFDNSEETGVLQKRGVLNRNITGKKMDQRIPDNSKRNEQCESHVKESGRERSEGTCLGEGDVSNHGKNRVNTEAAHRRKRWFDNREKSKSSQQVHILTEDNRATMEVDDELETGDNKVKHDHLGDMLNVESESSDTYGKLEPEHMRPFRDMEEANDRKRDKEMERIAVERAICEARERALAEAHERAKRAPVDKAGTEVCLKTAAQERPASKGYTDANNKFISDKACLEAKIRAERAAVERATAEARDRALQKALSDKAAHKATEKDNKTQTSSSGGLSTCASAEKSSGAFNESPQGRKARLERNNRTMERVAKALEEKNMRDSLAQREQAERAKFADALDSEVKIWSTGKEGNLRALLSTLQFILGPDSGWLPTSLTDLVSATAVRKAYKRAALCVHPDKLQQKGATFKQKYICEKVFDLLKEAWHKFNPDDR